MSLLRSKGEDFEKRPDDLWLWFQERRFPGEGWPLIRAGLASPVTRNRNMALMALGSWGEDRWEPEVEPTLRSALAVEPDDEVRKLIEEVLSGDILESPDGPK